MIELRGTFGENTSGRGLTLIIISTGDVEEPLEAAIAASHEHPARVIVVDTEPEAPSSGLDAEIRVGRDAGAAEVVILRARGDVLSSLDTLVMALLLRSEEHTSELQSRFDLVCRLLLEKKNKYTRMSY